MGAIQGAVNNALNTIGVVTAMGGPTKTQQVRKLDSEFRSNLLDIAVQEGILTDEMVHAMNEKTGFNKMAHKMYDQAESAKAFLQATETIDARLKLIDLIRDRLVDLGRNNPSKAERRMLDKQFEAGQNLKKTKEAGVNLGLMEKPKTQLQKELDAIGKKILTK